MSDLRLGGVLRERQPRRRGAARRQRTSARMDFATRDRYRHAIEDLARGSGRSELEVDPARRSPMRGGRAAARPPGAPPGGRAEDPGYYLISRGAPLLEKEIGYRVPLKQRLLARLRLLGDAGLPRDHRHRHRAAPRAPARSPRTPRAWSPLALVLARPRRPRSRPPISRSRSSTAPSRICSARGRCRASSCATASRRARERSS